ncbi:MAG: cellulase [Bacteroidales bacterium]|nr:cellulase [Bacteroidales bacterium]
MNRKDFIKTTSAAAASLGLLSAANSCKDQPAEGSKTGSLIANTPKGAPLAISMWDFSWLERRWTGAGFEDWDMVLDQFVERGYNAIRMDAFPHLVARDPEKEWTLEVLWTQSDWGSPARNKITVQPAMNEFLSKCKDRGIMVGLSSWYREDSDNVRMQVSSPEIHAEQWIKTLDMIREAGLLDIILYVDLCNEWPGDLWAPYFTNDPPELTWGGWYTEQSLQWMRTAIGLVQEKYPDLPVSFSFEIKEQYYRELDVSFADFLDDHIWMAQQNGNEFADLVEYKYDRFKPDSYNALAKNGEKLYREKPDYWQNLLINRIKKSAEESSKIGLPLITTECWGVVDYKDWPLLNWDWVKELCALGTETAAATGQWVAIATSNFCEPQFKGMWDDIEWHRRLTDIIKNSAINISLNESKLGSKFLNRLSR